MHDVFAIIIVVTVVSRMELDGIVWVVSEQQVDCL